MNTKTTFKRAYNYYDGSDHAMGRDSPGALLDMLAEVASQTLHSEKKRNELTTESKPKVKTEPGKRKTQDSSYNSSQLLSMPATQLVKQFSVFTSDELKRQYSYTCSLVPGCGQRYTSFASEGRARMSIKAHLADHLEYLKRDEEAYLSFTATAVKNRSMKTSPPNKKARTQQLKKPQETLNKENKDVKPEKSTNYLRKILSNEMNFTEFEKHKTLAKMNKNTEACTVEIKKEPTEVEFKVLGDHSYYEQTKEEISNGNVSPDLGDMMVDEAMEENIMLMVVESDGVHMKELPYIAQGITASSNQQESNTIYLPEQVGWSEEGYARTVEMSAPAKPKGKAKFIGTSKEEREMALALMERIKKKGNPSGGNLQCRICDPPRSFTAPTTLVSHYRSHAGIKPYECRICRAVFTRRHSLKYHMLIHQNQTRFTCADCGKKFRHPSHFREHRRRHTGEAPFGCDDCGQRFKTRNTYKRHLKTRHGKVLTTTGELLHLSEEDFKKVRTNPKRRPENMVPENMVDEDIIAPKAIIHYQNGDSSDTVENQVIEDLAADYQAQTEEHEDDDNRVWVDEELVHIEREENYRDYEIFAESHENKTESTETEITVETSELENEEYEVSQLEYRVMQVEDMEEEGSDHTATVDDHKNNQNEVLYEESVQDEDSNEVQYSEDLEIIQEDNLQYHENIQVFQEEQSDDEIHVVQHESHLNYFEDDSSEQNEVQFCETVETSQDAWSETACCKDGDEFVVGELDQNNFQEKTLQYQIGVVPEQRLLPLDQEEQTVQQNRIILVGSKETQVLQCVDSTIQRQVEVEKQIRRECLLLKEPTLESKEMALKLEQKEYLEPDKLHETSQPNVTVERIVEYEAMAACETKPVQTADNIQRVYLTANQSNSIVIQNKDLVNLLSHRIKLQQQNQQKLQFTKSGKVVPFFSKQPQAFNLVQNGKQGAILLLANSDLKSNFLKIDQSSIVNEMKTLPVVAVQQK